MLERAAPPRVRPALDPGIGPTGLDCSEAVCSWWHPEYPPRSIPGVVHRFAGVWRIASPTAHPLSVKPNEPTHIPAPATPELDDLPDVVDLDSPLRLGDGADVASVVPYLLGFHPTESIVVLVCVDGRLEMTARLPLGMADEPLMLDQQIRSMAARVPHAQWILAGYGQDRQQVIAALELVTALVGTEWVLDSLYVGQDRYWSLTCTRPDCCPAEGRPYDASTSPAALQAVVAGLQALDRREDLEQRIRPPRGWSARSARRRVDDAYAIIRQLGYERSAERFEELIERGLYEPADLGVEDLAMMAACAYYSALRDVAFRRLTRANATMHVALWQAVVQATARDDQASPLAMLALASWVSGDGAMQVVCMERGEKIAPGHSLLRLLDDINRSAAPPMIWDQMMNDLYASEGVDLIEGFDEEFCVDAAADEPSGS